jgi:ATP-binding cassette subfamily B protein
LLDAVVGLGQGGLTLLGFVGALLAVSPLMTALVLAAALPALGAQVSLSRRRARTLWEIQPHHRREFFYGQLLGSVAAAKEIRLFGLGGFLRGRLLEERGTSNAAMRRADARELSVQSGLSAAGAALAGAGLVIVVLAARRGELTPGDVAMFLSAVAGVQSAVNGVVHATAQAHQHVAAFGHFVAVVDGDPDLPIAASPVALPPLRHGIELRDVWFRYGDTHPWVLRGVSLFIPCGQSVALVGLNGAGKSTLVKLLCRLYDPTRGLITWDGVDLRDVEPAHLRRRVSAVFQDHMNYDLTAAENIAVGDLTALGDQARLHAAAARAGVDTVIAALPSGYDTPLTRMFDTEDTTVVLSGGQWQRIALARAFVRDGRDLMILDEPSSGLDPEAEHELHATIREHRAGATSLLISHRLNAVREADRIAVLDQGQIRESGDHLSLLASGGAYAHLFALQAEGYVDA